jgi:hypothetical protein
MRIDIFRCMNRTEQAKGGPAARFATGFLIAAPGEPLGFGLR